MAQVLNRFSLLIVIVFLNGVPIFAQEEDYFKHNIFDYKDPEQFKNYNKRSKVVSAWQIAKLREGAIVVRLRNNQNLIEQLIKAGKPELAKEKLMEQFAINKNTMFAYLDNLTYCKLYFIYSNSSDSLMNGTRKGIFLDTNLTINSEIELKESYYILAERDYGFNSSIGFVKEDSAKFVKEHGTAVRMMAVILKNKYGHQMKDPFPYLVKEKNFMDSNLDFPITVLESESGTQFQFKVYKTYFADLAEDPKNRSKYMVRVGGNVHVVHLKKQFTYEKIAEAVTQLNVGLERFYKHAQTIDEKKLDKKFFPYLY